MGGIWPPKRPAQGEHPGNRSSQQPQGEHGDPISQLRKLRLLEGSTPKSQRQGQLPDSSQCPPPGSHCPQLTRGWNLHPSIHCGWRGGERKGSARSVPLSLGRLSRRVCQGLSTPCTASRPCSLRLQPQTGYPVPAWGTKAAGKAQPRGPQGGPGSARLPPQPDRHQEVKAGAQDRRPQATLAP